MVGFHYGAGHRKELQSLRQKSFLIILLSSAAMFLLAEALAVPLSALFVRYDPALIEMTIRAFRLYSFSFLFSGIAIFGSSFFTALSDGLTSALISFLRTLLFQSAAVLVCPMLWGLDGIWISVAAAEAVAAMVTLIFLAAKQKRFGY